MELKVHSYTSHTAKRQQSHGDKTPSLYTSLPCLPLKDYCHTVWTVPIGLCHTECSFHFHGNRTEKHLIWRVLIPTINFVMIKLRVRASPNCFSYHHSWTRIIHTPLKWRLPLFQLIYFQRPLRLEGQVMTHTYTCKIEYEGGEDAESACKQTCQISASLLIDTMLLMPYLTLIISQNLLCF